MAPDLAFSHIGIFVRDLERMADFYARVLGFAVSDRGELDTPRGKVSLVFLTRDPREHHQIVLVEGRSGSLDDRVINQISLRVDTLTELKARYDLVKRESEVSDINPTDHGNAWSLYFRDPEKNRIELFVDSPWYVEQPRVDPLDLEANEKDIVARTRATIETHPSFRPIEDWQREFATKLSKKMEEAVR
jgi:catechol-2,3-dioxygenase